VAYCRSDKVIERNMTATWRYIGSLASFDTERKQGKSREEIQARSIEGWTPWLPLDNWKRVLEPGIVVPNPCDPTQHLHLYTFVAGHRGAVVRFAHHRADDGADHFWFPARPSEPGAFAVPHPSLEGHWRLPDEPNDDRPWPAPDSSWGERSAFVDALGRVESMAETIVYRGKSTCRLCGEHNGHRAYRLREWEWPEGYRHYLVDHMVRPTPAFEAFVGLMDTRRP
jgi:hypothetical protein